jgi:pSer/pThr/pTyr-binding forkhead associated (FHA) protein
MPWLKMLKGGTTGTTFPLDREVVILGRDPACEISLPSHEVSRRHSRIVRKGKGYHIEDLQSTNGTRVGDRDLTGIRRLEHGDLIEIDNFRFVSLDAEPSILGVLDASSTVVLEASNVRHPEDDPPIFSRTTFGHVTDGGQAVLCRDVGADSRFCESKSVKETRIRTMMCVPLRARDQRPFGFLQIDTGDEQGRFEQEDLDLLGTVAGPVSVAIGNARLHEVAVKQEGIEQEARDARAVQLALIPKHKPQLPGYESWDHYQLSGRHEPFLNPLWSTGGIVNDRSK